MIGTGTLADPYRISSVADLQAVASDMGAGVYYVIDADIDLAGIEWTPLGDDVTPFSCNIDGNGHTILNLTITASTLTYIGLIGYAYQAMFNKIVMTGASVSSDTGIGSSIGCLVGGSEESIFSDCEINGTIDGSDSSAGIGIIAGYIRGAGYGMYRCKSTGTIINGSNYIGGIVGAANDGPDLIDCVSDVVITSPSAGCVGGIAGYVSGAGGGGGGG